MTGYRSPLPPGRDGFAQLVRAEWTKLRSVPGWVAGLTLMAVTVVGLGLLVALGSSSACMAGDRQVACPTPPLGPEGDAVVDDLHFLHQPLSGDGSITVRVTGMSGDLTDPQSDEEEIVDGMVPWAKTGLMVKENLKQGSSYAAVMTTAGHGVRMQHDYKYDSAGKPGRPSPDAPRWLRLDRDGDTVTGSESSDGRTWHTVATVRPANLPDTIHIGMFATSPESISIDRGQFAAVSGTAQPATVTGVFDEVDAPGDDWEASDVGATEAVGDQPHHPGEHTEDGGTFTVSGNGDIAPHTVGMLATGVTLPGVWIGLIVLIVIGVGFATAEHRRGLIRTTLLASPRRGRVLLAKATVLGTVTFVLALIAVTVTLVAGKAVLRGDDTYTLPMPAATEVRIVVGAAAVLALISVLALAVGALLRHGPPAAAATAAVMILPFLTAVTAILPPSVPQWLLRVTPAAGFAIMQAIPEYPHVHADYSVAAGYFPLPPWAGLLVLAAFAAATLWLATRRLSRSDA